MSKCSVCNANIESESPAILVMGSWGNPRYMCDECAKDFDTATLGRDLDEISAAMDRIGDKMSENDPDKQVYDTVNSILAEAAERAREIKDGSYDFSSDEEGTDKENAFDDIPEELRETEADRELDRIDEENNRRFDKFFNYVLIGVGIAFVGFVIWMIIDKFF